MPTNATTPTTKQQHRGSKQSLPAPHHSNSDRVSLLSIDIVDLSFLIPLKACNRAPLYSKVSHSKCHGYPWCCAGVVKKGGSLSVNDDFRMSYFCRCVVYLANVLSARQTLFRIPFVAFCCCRLPHSSLVEGTFQHTATMGTSNLWSNTGFVCD